MDDFRLFANQVVDQCESTNTIAKNLAEAGYPHGTWVSARVQTAGRGRLGRRWESIQGNLFLSVIARIPKQSLWSWVALTAGVAVVKTIRSIFPEIAAQLKWPNDIYFQNEKLGGILCEGVGNQSSQYIIIGIGLNCLDAPHGLDQPTTDLTTARGGELITADQIRIQIISALLEELDVLQKFGPSRVVQFYDSWTTLPAGTEVEWGEPLQSGVVQSLGQSGELQIIHTDGSLVSVFADDVKLKKI